MYTAPPPPPPPPPTKKNIDPEIRVVEQSLINPLPFGKHEVSFLPNSGQLLRSRHFEAISLRNRTVACAIELFQMRAQPNDAHVLGYCSFLLFSPVFRFLLFSPVFGITFRFRCCVGQGIRRQYTVVQ